MKLIVGNKNYSSWSLRPWLLLKQLGIPFDEECLSFNDPEFKTKALRTSDAGKVPILVCDDGTAVWDSLAIIETIAETFPDRGVWPEPASARAVARSLCAEMHSGFPALREHMPMNIANRFPGRGWNDAVERDVDRILGGWSSARSRFGESGDFLFGMFSAADAFFAPVVWRFETHEVEVPDFSRRYMSAVQALPAMQLWVAAALSEKEFVSMDEPYRTHPETSDPA